MPGVAERANTAQTFSTVTTTAVHWERATCATIGCPKLAGGWVCRIDESLFDGRRWAHYIRHVTARRGWTEQRTEAGVTVFRFEPGTPCFADGRDRKAHTTLGVQPHMRQVRPSLHIVSRGLAGQIGPHLARRCVQEGRQPDTDILRVHQRPADWMEHLSESWNAHARMINGN